MPKTVICSDHAGRKHEVPVDKLRWRPSAYGIVVKDDCLLVAPQFGNYDLPGGGIELGETIEEGLLREIKEETGIDAANPRLVSVHTSFFVLPDSKKGNYIEGLMFYYVCSFAGGELSDSGFDEDEKRNSAMPEWLPLTKLDAVNTGGGVDWRGIVKAALATKHQDVPQ